MSGIGLNDLEHLYRPPGRFVLDKSLPRIDRHARAFIALSPFCVVSSAGPDGTQDVSPRGGVPGFVQVSEDGANLHLPDRPGNNRLDTIRNLLSGSGQIGLMFMIPGFDDVLRVNGVAVARTEPDLLARFEEFGKTPRLVLDVTVQEAFLHCPKAIMRARLWEPEAQVERSTLPTLTEMVVDQLKLEPPPVTEAQILESYKTQL